MERGQRLQAACLEPLADAPCLRPAFVVEVALRAAVAEAEVRRVEGSGSQGMAERDHDAAGDEGPARRMRRGQHETKRMRERHRPR